MSPHAKSQVVLKKLVSLGPFLPGSISEQWNVCGTPGCKCKDQEEPQKHGPYYQLSFSIGGKSSTMFVARKNLAEVRRWLKRWKEFKDLSKQLAQAYVGLARSERFEPTGRKQA